MMLGLHVCCRLVLLPPCDSCERVIATPSVVLLSKLRARVRAQIDAMHGGRCYPMISFVGAVECCEASARRLHWLSRYPCIT